MPWHPVPRRAASAVLAVRLFTTCSRFISFAYLTCGPLIKLGLAYILCYFIRKLRFALVIYSGFTRGEYHIIRVDFIVALRRTKGRGRRTLRSPPSPSSGLHLIHPGDPLRRGMTAAAGLQGYRIPVSGAGRLSPVPNLVLLSVFGLCSFAFQSGCWAMVVHFSLLGGGTVRACGYVGFLLYSFVGFALTAIGAFVLFGNGMG